MTKTLLALSAAALLFTAAYAEEKHGDAHEAKHEVHWDYDAHGPAHWGEFSEICAQGKTQSPINIVTNKTVSIDKSHIVAIHEDVKTKASEIDNGHAIQVNIENGGTVTADGVNYKLVQFHFHGRSEEMINGKQYDLVGHMVHKSASGNLLVIAVLFEEGKTKSKMVQTVIESVGKNIEVNPAELLPKDTDHYYEFTGSLTTPPCSENVKWVVMKEIQSATKEQIGAMRKFYDHNYRPTQALNDRIIESK